MTRFLLIALAVVACESPYPSPYLVRDEPEPAPMAIALPEAAGVVGMTWGGACEHRDRLAIDSSWSPIEADAIRSAAQEWSEAVGVDLGGLPARDCAGAPACIERSADCEARATEIYHFTRIVICPDTTEIPLRTIALHELGHFVGIPHLAAGVMAHVPTADDLTSADLMGWAGVCQDGTM